ncbi:LysR substrate-binding domain-containing protein [Methylobacterium sp. P31]
MPARKGCSLGLWYVRDGAARITYVPVPILRLSSLPMLRDAVVAGAGAAVLPRSLVGRDVAAGRLACRGMLEGPPNEVWALHTSRRLVSPEGVGVPGASGGSASVSDIDAPAALRLWHGFTVSARRVACRGAA